MASTAALSLSQLQALHRQWMAALAPEQAPGGLPTRLLGRTGERVSALGLGGYHLGLAEPAEAPRIVHAAIDQGITFLDNCWDYLDGESERRMGAALAGGYRQKVFLMTKIDGQFASIAARQLDESLRRLRTDCIDLVQFHEIIRPDDGERIFSQDGAMQALERARQAGKLRYVGFTGHKSPQVHLSMLRAARAAGVHLDTVQMPLNVMDAHFRSFQHEVLPVATDDGVAVLGMKSLAAGPIATCGVVTPEECIRYSLGLPISVLIVGCQHLHDVEQAVRIGRTFSPLTEEETRDLLARSRSLALAGSLEGFKTTHDFDGTQQNPQWLADVAFPQRFE